MKPIRFTETKKNSNIYTVITGASMGLGKSLAESCARMGKNLILISLPGDNIQLLANALRKRFRIEARGIETDLTKKHELNLLIAEINRNYAVDILINNAGAGGSSVFRDASPEYLYNILMLNTWSLVRLTHGLLPNLENQQQSYILNIASMASFGPMPYKTVYPASKSFVYSFTRGLYAELKRTNIFVSVAHPGGMATNRDVTRRIEQYGPLVRSTLLSPEHTAEVCIRRLLKKDSLIIPGFANQVNWLLFRIIPVWFRLNVFRKPLLREIEIQNLPSHAI